MAVLREDATTPALAEAQETINSYLVPGLGLERGVQRYHETADSYDAAVGLFDYRGPAMAAKTLAELHPEKERKEVRILDVACGTGLVGEELAKLGFEEVDGLDPAKGMIDKALMRCCYNMLINDYLDSDHEVHIENNTYDTLVVCGGMGENLIPCGAFKEMIRIVKPGGRIVNVTRVEHLETCGEYQDRLEPEFKRLEEAGKWKQVKRSTFPDFLRGKEGIVLIHKVL